MDANATLQGLFIVAYFIAPWFLHYYVSRTFGLGSDADPSDLQLLIRSLCFTLILIAAEAGVLVSGALFWPGLKEQVQSFVADGPLSYVHERPFLLTGTATLALGFNLAVSSITGYFRFPDSWIEAKLRRAGFTQSSAWVAILTSHGHARTDGARQMYRAARVRMKSGAVYAGFVASFDIRAGKDGSRDIAIWQAQYAPPPPRGTQYPEPPPLTPLPPGGGGNAVIVNSNEISSLEIFYVPYVPAPQTSRVPALGTAEHRGESDHA